MDNNTNESNKKRLPRVLVTGASGFVGSVIAEHCYEAGMKVLPTGHGDAKKTKLPGYFRADVTDPKSLIDAMADVDCVVHAAGLAHQSGGSTKQPQFSRVNVKGTENVAAASVRAGVKHFILISSVSVYGPHGKTVCNEELECNPRGPYAQSKFEAEQRGIETIKDSDARLTILRLATVYGEGDPGNLARLVRTIDRGRFVWIGDGENRKSLIHRVDVARACVKVLRTAPQKISTYNVVGSVNTMREVVNGIASALGRDLPRWRISSRVAKAMAISFDRISQRGKHSGIFERTVGKWLDDDVYDGSKFNKEFEFSTSIGLQEGLRREVDWYGQNR